MQMFQQKTFFLLSGNVTVLNRNISQTKIMVQQNSPHLSSVTSGVSLPCLLLPLLLTAVHFAATCVAIEREFLNVTYFGL